MLFDRNRTMFRNMVGRSGRFHEGKIFFRSRPRGHRGIRDEPAPAERLSRRVARLPELRPEFHRLGHVDPGRGHRRGHQTRPDTVKVGSLMHVFQTGCTHRPRRPTAAGTGSSRQAVCSPKSSSMSSSPAWGPLIVPWVESVTRIGCCPFSIDSRVTTHLVTS